MLIPRDAWAVFRKDGLEVLRDRRTLFVNLVLPVLLYPLVLLFLLQVLQLSKAQQRERPRIGAVGLPAGLDHHLQRLAGTGGEPVARADAGGPAPGPADGGKAGAKPGGVVGEALSGGLPGPFTLVTDLDGGPRLAALFAPVIAPGQPAPTGGRIALAEPVRQEALQLMRREGLAAVILVAAGQDHPARLLILVDDANSRLEEVRGPIDQAIGAWRQELIEGAVQRGGLDLAVLRPVLTQQVGLAPPAEAVRTRIAGVIPYILVLLAVAAAFNPAIDLMAGERERGTLETLLALPARRRDIITGKLMVVCSAALAAVVLNLLSLGFSMVLLGAQLNAAGGGGAMDLAASFRVGVAALVLCFIVLAPLVVAIAALAIGIAGFAASSKEAQNYLTPLLLVVMFAAIVALVPSTQPSYALDLIPITGAVLALKEALQSSSLPWQHLVLATLSNVAFAAVIVGWSTQLLERESFRYPGLVRAGWGRWRRWWPPGERVAHQPGGIEVLIVYAVAVAGMTLGGGLLSGLPSVAFVVLPLLLFVALPAAGHAWLGAYDPRTVLGLRNPGWHGIAAALLILPLGITLSAGLDHLQALVVDPSSMKATADKIQAHVDAIDRLGGPLLLVLCLGVTPGLCEELLCRGTLLSGLRRGVGRPWAVVLTAFLFAALHTDPLRFVPQMTLGILLALLTLRIRSVVPAMIVHAGHNSVLIVLSHVDVPMAAIYAVAATSLPLAWIGLRLARPAPGAESGRWQRGDPSKR